MNVNLESESTRVEAVKQRHPSVLNSRSQDQNYTWLQASQIFNDNYGEVQPVSYLKCGQFSRKTDGYCLLVF